MSGPPEPVGSLGASPSLISRFASLSTPQPPLRYIAAARPNAPCRCVAQQPGDPGDRIGTVKTVQPVLPGCMPPVVRVACQLWAPPPVVRVACQLWAHRLRLLRQMHCSFRGFSRHNSLWRCLPVPTLGLCTSPHLACPSSRTPSGVVGAKRSAPAETLQPSARLDDRLQKVGRQQVNLHGKGKGFVGRGRRPQPRRAARTQELGSDPFSSGFSRLHKLWWTLRTARSRLRPSALRQKHRDGNTAQMAPTTQLSRTRTSRKVLP